MAVDQSTVWTLGIIAACASGAWGWFNGKSLKVKDNEHNRRLRESLESERAGIAAMAAETSRRQASEHALAVAELDARTAYVTAMRANLEGGMLQGRKWLAAFVADADRAYDESVVRRLRDKSRPALIAAEQVAAARAERRQFKEQAKFLEYQLLALKEYFPFIEEYEEELLDESSPLQLDESDQDLIDEPDPVARLLSRQEYERLTSAERNQLALERYLNKPWGRAAVGRAYEHYIGHLMEQDGWFVEYHGINKKFADMGRDLICSRGDEVKIVQTKCWSRNKTIHEKHIFQLAGTTLHFELEEAQQGLFKRQVSARFVTSTLLSPVARQAAEWLKVEVDEDRPLRKDFPMIKCNINQQTLERIYHLPFDQQYERTAVHSKLGECIVATAAEAEAKGFRRAWRHRSRG